MMERMEVIEALYTALIDGKDTSLVGIALIQPVVVDYAEELADLPESKRRTVLEDELSYNWLMWESDVYPKPTEEEFNTILAECEKVQYRQQRREAYPDIAEQLDILYHDGYAGWRASIEAVKQQFPKPEV